jgi:hypothetical protein
MPHIPSSATAPTLLHGQKGELGSFASSCRGSLRMQESQPRKAHLPVELSETDGQRHFLRQFQQPSCCLPCPRGVIGPAGATGLRPSPGGDRLEGPRGREAPTPFPFLPPFPLRGEGGGVCHPGLNPWGAGEVLGGDEGW